MLQVPYLNLEAIHKPIRDELDGAYRGVMERQWFIGGEADKTFEAAFAAYCGTDYCVGTGNGLDAIRLILLAYGIGAGDEVIVPANTFIATVLAITYVGAAPVFVDADPDRFSLDEIFENVVISGIMILGLSKEKAEAMKEELKIYVDKIPEEVFRGPLGS